MSGDNFGSTETKRKLAGKEIDLAAQSTTLSQRHSAPRPTPFPQELPPATAARESSGSGREPSSLPGSLPRCHPPVAVHRFPDTKLSPTLKGWELWDRKTHSEQAFGMLELCGIFVPFPMPISTGPSRSHFLECHQTSQSEGSR
jgi:hypothetical protein